MNDGKTNEIEESYFDVYLQEYYMHCYSLLVKNKNEFQESKEGFTYVPNDVEAKVSAKVLIFMAVNEHSGWAVKTRRVVKKIKKNELDEFDTDYIDADQLLGMYTDEFRANKRNTAKRIQK